MRSSNSVQRLRFMLLPCCVLALLLWSTSALAGGSNLNTKGCTLTPPPMGNADPVCDNGYDDDGDGLCDVADPGCRNRQPGSIEDPECDNQDMLGAFDDDSDGLANFGEDPECETSWWNDESVARSAGGHTAEGQGGCGGSPEVAFFALPFAWLFQRRRA